MSKKHGCAVDGKRTAVYDAWVNMKQRCLNPNHPSYLAYGGRGIKVCRRWVDSFTAFANDMGPRPAGATLERRNNDAGYSPSNCCWATRSNQQYNRRNNTLITFRGRTMALKRWAIEVGISHVTLRQRLAVARWSVEEALTTPPLPTQNRNAVKRVFKGCTMAKKELIVVYGRDPVDAEGDFE
jgi:hypothetical protein